MAVCTLDECNPVDVSGVSGKQFELEGTEETEKFGNLPARQESAIGTVTVGSHERLAFLMSQRPCQLNQKMSFLVEKCGSIAV
jgi:hypothetical protein